MTAKRGPQRLTIEGVPCHPYGVPETMADGTWQTYVPVDEVTHRLVFEVEVKTRRIYRTYQGYELVSEGK